MENESNRYKMSQERLDELKKELEYDETVREKEVSELIKEARSFGDLSENSEYDEAKTEQGKLYSRIAELKNLIENAEVIERIEVKEGEVNLGCKVKLLDMEEDEETTYEIVGSQEANPMMGRISDDSPVGKALLGHAAGDIVSVEVQPGIFLKFKVLKVVSA
jgi:transcription elongation factor GreA